MGDEDLLRYDLLDATRGREPRSPTWKKSQGSDAYFSGVGSQNIYLMRFATQTLRGWETPWEAVYDYQLGRSYGGSEFLSLIYWPWHLASHLSLCRSPHPGISERARYWCALNWALCRELQGGDGSLLFFGQRSAGHAPIPREMDYLFALASDGDIRRAEGWCKRAGVGLGRSWVKEMGEEVRAEMRETWKQSLSITLDTLASLPLRVPSEIIRTSQGLALIHARTANSNTAPILAGTLTITGERRTFPEKGGWRFRHHDDAVAWVDEERWEIAYRSSAFTEGKERRMGLPGGERVRWVKMGIGTGTGTVDTGAGTSEPNPDTPSRDLSHAADLLSSLLLPRAERGRQAAIVEALRAGQAPEPFLPTVRGWFCPDSTQLQATAWREAIRIMEGP